MIAASTKFDFFMSRRGSVAHVAREVSGILGERGYKVLVQDYDIPIGASFVDAMHEAVKNARDLLVLYTADYETSPYTRKEFTSFEAERAQSLEQRRIIVLRCEDVPLRGLLADNVYQDLVGVTDADERRRRILAAADGLSQAQKPPPRPFIGVPPRIASFTGREEELSRLDAVLVADKPASVSQASERAALQGLGGIGKTSIAIEYAHRFRDLHAGVWWCPAETRSGLLTSLAALSVTLGTASAEDADIETAAKAGLRRLTEQRATWLLVYDNVISPDDIADLLPSSGARVLITSRFPDWKEWAEEVSLDVLPEEAAVTFLQERAGVADQDGARTLAQALGRLPLALNHAAAYCRRTQMSFATYAATAAKLITTAPRGVAYPRSVAATFDLAISEATKACRTAEVLMTYLAFCAPERIPTSLIDGAVGDEAERRTALGALMDVSLVKQDPFEDGTAALTVHRLVQAVAKARAELQGTTQAVAESLIRRLEAIYPKDSSNNPRSWPLCARLMPHLVARSSVDPAATAASNLPDLLVRAGLYSISHGLYDQAVLFFREALAAAEKAYGADHLKTAASLKHLGSSLRYAGDLSETLQLYERALRICEEQAGADHAETASMLCELGALLHQQGDLTRAYESGARALAIREKVLGPEHPDVALSLNNVGRLLDDQGETTLARPLLERSLSIREKALGAEHIATVVSRESLASLRSKLGELDEARLLYEQVVTAREAIFGLEHPETARGLINLASLLQREGALADAIVMVERAVSTLQKVAPSSFTLISGQKFLAELLIDTDCPVDALKLAETSLAGHLKQLGPHHARTQDAARVAARALDALGRSEAASMLRERFAQ